MNKIVRLKHWQVFSIIAIGYIMSYVLPSTNFKIGNLTSIELAAIATTITLFLLFFWTLTIGLFLNSISKNRYHFKNWILILAIFSCILGYTYLNLQRLKLANDFFPFWVEYISALLTVWGIYYSFYQVSKSLKSMELNREARFSECIIDAITLFALPIGVWIIQPRVNKIFRAIEQIETEIKR